MGAAQGERRTDRFVGAGVYDSPLRRTQREGTEPLPYDVLPNLPVGRRPAPAAIRRIGCG